MAQQAAGPRKIQLQQLSTVRSSPKFSFAGRPDGSATDKRSKSQPGPGTYGIPSLKEKFHSTPSFGFGSGQRESTKDTKWGEKFKIPGPGSYTATDPYGKGSQYGFGSQARIPKRRLPDSPPPGTYHKETRMGGKEFTMSGRYTGGKMIAVPGPGTYAASIEPTRTAPPQWGFGFCGRKDLKKDAVPGPGSYEPISDLGAANNVTKASPSYSMKSRRRPVKSDSTPGPSFPPYSQFD
mmetsp:Transcript_6723/g.11573  ORF Transcript_6723/g.11573 Transcript_6723/m.11573 type:complete len:237 (+) Transcript_6723:102-812(+)